MSAPSDRVVAGLDQVEAARVTGQTDVHAVHDVADAELGIGISPPDGPAGTEVAERRGAAEPDLADHADVEHETETELDLEAHQHDVRSLGQLRRRGLDLLGREQAD